MEAAQLREERRRGAFSSMRLPFRSWLRELRHAPDRLLHPWRRARARTAVARDAKLESVLFLCHGNVCRSPYAAMAFSRLSTESGLDVHVTSAGFIGPGRSSPELALAAAGRRGVDMSAHCSALVTAETVRAAGLVVVMSVEQARDVASRFGGRRTLVLGDLDPRAIRRRTVIDPWGGDASVFDESYDRIDRCLGELVRAMREAR